MNLLFRMNYGVLYKRGEKVNHLSSVNQMNPFYLVVFYAVLIVDRGWFHQLQHIHVKTVRNENIVITSVVISIIKDLLLVKLILLRLMRLKIRLSRKLNILVLIRRNYIRHSQKLVLVPRILLLSLIKNYKILKRN